MAEDNMLREHTFRSIQGMKSIGRQNIGEFRGESYVTMTLGDQLMSIISISNLTVLGRQENLSTIPKFPLQMLAKTVLVCFGHQMKILGEK